MASAEMSAATFEGLVHERFAIEGTQAELTEVERHEGNPRVESFSVRFLAPLAASAGQGMRRVNHPKTGDLDLFLVPIGHSEEGLVLEAVFNRIKSEGGA